MKNNINQRGHELAKAFFGRKSAISREKSRGAGNQKEMWKRGQKNPVVLVDLREIFNSRRNA